MAKVSLITCREYDIYKVKKAIIESFDNLGGIHAYINKGEKVLLKLNLVMKKRPEEATTTHPIFTQALAQVLIDYGAEVLIGDSPGGPFNERMLRGIYKVCGIEEVAEKTGAELNFNTKATEVRNEKGKMLKTVTVTEMLRDVDKVISVSKLKTHGMAVFTGAVKNMFGVVPGTLKAEYHLNMPRIKEFSEVLVDICMVSEPVLSFMDGIVGMEGAGPSAGDPREIGVVLASNSPYHLDVAATSIIGLDPKEVPTIQRCIERNICKGNFEDIELMGETIEHFRLDDFKIPQGRSVDFIDKMPKMIHDILKVLIKPKPVFVHKDCIGCRDCVENCPPKVIEMVNNRPEVNLEGCIRCFCCQELCPKKAVLIHTPVLNKLLSKL